MKDEITFERYFLKVLNAILNSSKGDGLDKFIEIYLILFSDLENRGYIKCRQTEEKQFSQFLESMIDKINEHL